MIMIVTWNRSALIGLLAGFALLWAPVARCEDYEDHVFLSCPPNITINLTLVKAEAVATWQPPEISDTSGDYNFTSDHSSGDVFPIGDTTVHYTATDASSNTATCEFVVSVKDLRVLEFSNCPTDITQILQSGQSRDVAAWREPIISLEGREVSVTANHRPGELFDLGRTEVSYTAVDTLGNSAYCNFIVIVTGYPYNHFVLIEDSFLPGRDDRILLHSSVEECLIACIKEESFVCQSVDFSAKEKCMLSRTTAADLWGILAKHEGFAHYERLMEGTRPVLIGCPQHMTLPTEAGQAYATVSWREPTMSDGEPAVIKGTHSPKSRFYVGATRVVYTTSDSTGNTLSCDFFVTIKDEEPPIISNCPQNITKVTSDQEAVKASWVEPTATDNLGPPQLMSSNHRPGNWFPPGSTTVTYSARDNAGNRAECSFVILVEDIPDSNYIWLHLVLHNITYSDALQDNNSVEFQKLASTIEKDVLNIFRDDGTVLGVKIDRFRSDTDDGVAADVKIGFSEPLNHEDQQSKLHAILAAILNRVLANVAKVKLEQDNGKFQILDACTLSPCPATMNCRAIGLQCIAMCTDNAEYCLNGGHCGTNEQNLITCNCHGENQVYTYSGDRCDLTRMALSGKQLTIISLGGVWAAIMLGMLAMYCIAFRCRRRRKGEASIPLHVFADSPAEVPRGTHMVTSDDLGYTSQGEDELSPAESDSHIRIHLEDSREESPLDQSEGRPGGRLGAHDSMVGPHEGSARPHDGSTRPRNEVPGTHGGIPGTHDGIPGTHGGIPGTHDGIPDTHDGISGTHDGIPGTHDGIPGTHGGIPGTHDGIPGTHGGIPGTHDGIPGTHDGIPGTHDGILSPQGSKASPQESSLGSHDNSAIPGQSQSSSSCSSCTSCSSASDSSDCRSHTCSSCTCDSGTEVVQFPSLGDSNTTPKGAAITPTATPPQMTVQVDVERIPFEPSDSTHSYDGMIPDPLVESDVSVDESVPLINPHPQALDPPETTPFLSHCFDREMPECDQPISESASLLEIQPQVKRENMSEQRSVSSHGTHSYEGTIPDPVSEFDERRDKQSGDIRDPTPTGDGAPIELYNDESSSGQLFNIPSIHFVEESDDIVMTEEYFV
ncbi:uncharacterized protein LOC119740947 isoform X2 [Patiria miniata]|uniref:Uncharacterized protein n=1 Tax=Patiria miniata TaxID=46514 RepID=A0A914BAB4_PATMI|nr:uncharacterized protein LOC119740947 isoform X2 [Patiria miniata]